MYTTSNMIVDTFMFYNELDVLELRLNLLDSYVDRFVLVESEVTHAGGPKPLFFEQNKDRYTKWLPKIKHIVLTAEEAPKDENPWSREKYQRNLIMKGLEDLQDDTFVMVSDVDEIPNMPKVTFVFKSCISLHMYMFEYSFDYMFTGEPWVGTTVTRLKELRHLGPNFFRDTRWRHQIIPYSGWHLSSFGDAAHVNNKMHTFAHAKDGHHDEQTEDIFKIYIAGGLHTDGKTKLLPRPANVVLPNGWEKFSGTRLNENTC